MELQKQYEQALVLFQQGKMMLADEAFQKLLNQKPDYYPALYGLAYLKYHIQDFKTSFDLTQNAIRLAPLEPQAVNLLGQLYIKAGQKENAENCFKECIRIAPNYSKAYFNLGKLSKADKKLTEAEAYFRKSLELSPNDEATMNNLANCLPKNPMNEEAISLYQKALSLNPNLHETRINLGNVYAIGQKFDDAKKCFTYVLEQEPSNPKAHAGIASVFLQLKDLENADLHSAKAIQISPQLTEAIMARINYLKQIGKEAETIPLYNAVLHREPGHFQALLGLGIAMMNLSYIEESEKLFERAVKVDPESAEAWFQLGSVSEVQKKYFKALNAYSQSEKKVKEIPDILFFNQALLKRKLCDWSGETEVRQEIITRIDKFSGDQSPSSFIPLLTLNYFDIPPEYHLKAAQKTSEILIKSVPPNQIHQHPEKITLEINEKIRVGYISADFREHAVGYLLRDFFKMHNTQIFEVYAYSLTEADDEYTEVFRRSAKTFRKVGKLSPREIAEIIYRDRIHVLVDLTGHTTFSKPQTFVYRPAPVQVHYMGYLDTMGADFLPYLLADNVTIPLSQEKYFSETVLKLTAGMFFCSSLKISTTERTRKEEGLPENAFVYCCFNTTQKIDPIAFDTWMQILKETENTVLWLFDNDSEIVRTNLRKVAQESGIDLSRIIFATSLPLDQHLKRMELADLYLDTFIYGSGFSAWACLWAGLPVLTLPGNTFLSRISASILTSHGFHEWIASDRNAYINKAKNAAKAEKFIVKVFDTYDTINQNMADQWASYLTNLLIT